MSLKFLPLQDSGFVMFKITTAWLSCRNGHDHFQIKKKPNLSVINVTQFCVSQDLTFIDHYYYY